MVDEPAGNSLGKGGEVGRGKDVERFAAEEGSVDGVGEVGDVRGEEVGEAIRRDGASGWCFMTDVEELVCVLVATKDGW